MERVALNSPGRYGARGKITENEGARGTMLKDLPPHVAPERVVDIDIYHPPGGEIDIHEAWKTLHEPGVPDVVWTPRNGGHWIVTRYQAMREVYEDYRRFSSRLGNISEERL